MISHLEQARVGSRSKARDGLDNAGRFVDVPLRNFQEESLNRCGGTNKGKPPERYMYWSGLLRQTREHRLSSGRTDATWGIGSWERGDSDA